jgi:hypothetical protein
MKEILYFLSLLFLLGTCVHVHSQNVFPESDAIWNIQIDGKEHYYGLFGDTVIAGKHYNKLYLLSDTTFNIDSKDTYIGGFRQEEKKVWYRPRLPDNYINYDYPQYSEETLLYDFSKNVGDTIWHNIIPNPYIYYWSIGDSITASIIESMYTDEQGHKIYNTVQYAVHQVYKDFSFLGRTDSWMEGVGSTGHGLFWFLSSITTSMEPKFHLACFKQGNEVKYMDNPLCNSCFSSLSDVLRKSNIPFEIVYENNYIRIKGEPFIAPCELKLFFSTGQLVFEKKLQSSTEIIPINCQKGIYLYQIQKNTEIIKTGKIIIK